MKEKRIVMIDKETGYITYFNSGIFYDINERQYCVATYGCDGEWAKITYLEPKDEGKTWSWNIYTFFDCFVDEKTKERVSPFRLKPLTYYIACKGNKYWRGVYTDSKGEICMGNTFSQRTYDDLYKGYQIKDLDFFYTEKETIEIHKRNDIEIIDTYYNEYDFVRDFKLTNKQAEELTENGVLYGDEL